jgi:hypothetical protein
LSIYSFDVLASGAEDVNGSMIRSGKQSLGLEFASSQKTKKEVQINSILLAHDESVDCSPVIAW